MNIEQQRIAIAEACGFQFIKLKGRVAITHPDPDYPPGFAWGRDRTLSGIIPDYLSDLNAMHEAENPLTLVQKQKYRTILAMMFTDHPDDGMPQAIHATAAQRAEAFLKTLSLWKP
jgi:hypothetical protein